MCPVYYQHDWKSTKYDVVSIYGERRQHVSFDGVLGPKREECQVIKYFLELYSEKQKAKDVYMQMSRRASLNSSP